jgi:hypothetical protein
VLLRDSRRVRRKYCEMIENKEGSQDPARENAGFPHRGNTHGCLLHFLASGVLTAFFVFNHLTVFPSHTPRVSKEKERARYICHNLFSGACHRGGA